MPWSVRKKGSWWEIYKPDTGKVVGKSSSKGKADASVRARGGRLSDRSISMHELEHICATVVELNELTEAGWEVQTIVFSKDKYRTRISAISQTQSMGFSEDLTNEKDDGEEENWRIQQSLPGKFSEFCTQKLSDTVSIIYGK